MSLRSEFQAIPTEVFDDMGDVVITGTLRQYVSVYTEGGSVSNTPTDTPVRLIEDVISERELAGGIAKAGDRKFLTPASEINVVPTTKDSIITTPLDVGAETIYNVYAADIDPARALWVLFARQ